MRAFASLVFAWQGDRALVCDIAGRGWCVPSGRVEMGESSNEAASRETREEACAILANLQYIGSYKIDSKGQTRWADCFSGRVQTLLDFQPSAESLGRELMTVDQLESSYHLWNELTSQVFKHSMEVLMRAEAVAKDFGD